MTLPLIFGLGLAALVCLWAGLSASPKTRRNSGDDSSARSDEREARVAPNGLPTRSDSSTTDVVKPTGVSWSPSQSWVTNLGALGAFLTGLMTFAPSTVLSGAVAHMTREQYLLSSTFYVGLLGLGPALLAYLEGIQNASGNARRGYFIASSFITLSGAVAELFVVGFLVHDLYRLRLLPGLFWVYGDGVLSVIVVLLLVFAWRQMTRVPTEPGARRAEEMASVRIRATAATPGGGTRYDWIVL